MKNNYHFIKGTLSLVIFYFLCVPQNGFSQERRMKKIFNPTTKYIRLSSFILHNNKAAKGVDIRIMKKGTQTALVVTEEDGKFNYNLDLNSEYMVVFSQQGKITKSISFSTYVGDSMLADVWPNYRFVVDMIDGQDTEETISTPVGRFHWDLKKMTFVPTKFDLDIMNVEKKEEIKSVLNNLVSNYQKNIEENKKQLVLQEEAEKLKKEADEKAKQEMVALAEAERLKKERELKEKAEVVRKTEENARLEAERVRIAALENAKIEVEKARIKAIEKEKTEAAAKAKSDEEARSKLETEQLRKNAEDQARLEAEQLKKEQEEKRGVEEENRKREEEKMKMEEERIKKENEEKLRIENEKRKREKEESMRKEIEAKTLAEILRKEKEAQMAKQAELLSRAHALKTEQDKKSADERNKQEAEANRIINIDEEESDEGGNHIVTTTIVTKMAEDIYEMKKNKKEKIFCFKNKKPITQFTYDLELKRRKTEWQEGKIIVR